MGKPFAIVLTSSEVREVIRRLDGVTIPQRTLAGWASSELAVPSFWPKKRGRYHPRLYTFQDTLRVRLIAWLRVRYGISTQRVRTIMSALDAECPNYFSPKCDKQLVVLRDGVLVRGPNDPDVHLPSRQTSLRFDVPAISLHENAFNVARQVKEERYGGA